MRINFYDAKLTAEGLVTLVKDKGVIYKADTLNSPETIALMAHRVLGLDGMAEEHLYMLALNSACKLLGVFFVSKGTVNTSLVSPREIFIRALLSGAVQIVLIHNHPSGSVIPSQQDIDTTERMKKAGELLNISLADHIIIGSIESNTYLSFKEAGLL